MMTPEIRNHILTIVSGVVYVQLGLIVVLSVLTVFLLNYRRWRNHRLESHESSLSGQIVDELLALMDRREVRIVRRPWKVAWLEKIALKKAMLNQILSVNGLEKEYLVKRYFELGLSSDDIALCASSVWSQRLEGISNLKKLSSKKLAKVFRTFRDDPDPLVSAMSLSALSELRHPLNMIDILSIEKLILNGQQTYISEVTYNWSTIHGYENVFITALDAEKPEMREALLLSLLNIKTQECSDLFSVFLETAHYEAPKLLAAIIRTLKEIGDPECLDTVSDYTHHPDLVVQQRAIEFVLDFLPEERRGELRILELDPSLSVQRTLQEWNSRKAAA